MPLKIAPWVVPIDLQAIYDYHKLLSVAKAERIIAEYDRIIALLEVNPLLFHEREGQWRVYPFDSGTYLLYYKELDTMWLVAGVFHARRRPTWISEQLAERVESKPANQALEPTIPGVTPRAEEEPRVAPPGIVAHLER